ncbi:ATP-binding cassette domain-containing protein [Chelativorans sp. Marseille-P2723]|uniref:ABC transporter ATP-binding protein n=1 Tax=Chelativorans sp. Marseille-P2723 TaxID=2709133 RepID=UPI00156E0791|nr:ATP-binding cassette domain-containing protein [Chelativorans sp. Marseille-P2723]
MTALVLKAEGLSKTFRSHGRIVKALDNVSLALGRGETLGLAGPSGSGKSTFARVVLRLIAPDSGRVEIDGEDWLALGGRRLRARRRHVQMVFQDPLSAFNPRATVGGVLSDPLRIHALATRNERPHLVDELLERVGLSPELARRAIHEISGGQRQRVAIARALATRPSLIVLDEAVSALDVSLRGRILELLAGIQKAEGISYIFVSHDLAAVRIISHRVAIMDEGRIVETGPTESVISNPQSATAQTLVESVPKLALRPE